METFAAGIKENIFEAYKPPSFAALQARFKHPDGYWIEINERLVPFGKWVCTSARPKCSTCPLLSMCRQVGVTSHR